MPSRSDNTSKWKDLSQIDYFGLFIKNWLAFNSWYRGHHPNLESDRHCIEAIKNTQDARNSAYIIFNRLLTGTGKDAISFRDNLDGLATSLSRVTLTVPPRGTPTVPAYIGALSFNNALIDKSSTNYQNLIRTSGQHHKISIGSIFVIDDSETLYKGSLELIYQIRCLLFHGDLEPSDENHQIVKYAYLVINAIMENL
ncbi:MAG TPA: hypothetical protein DD723_00225 [Candidatus Omnitrophica bacterium]|nr:MAG: hypothetical protein A2Z81_04520 [Omnitrophica WOR_2 bacterium GWA2_45_18]HBR13961.1 hypothetical protein [Candidatus Omnitrophota bacterium]